MSFCTHIKSGEITVERIGGTHEFRYRFKLSGIRDTGSTIPFGQGIFSFGDGNMIDGDFNVEITPLGDELELNELTVEHVYSSPSAFYIVSYREENRNAEVLNMENSVNTPFYIETQIKLDPFFGINNSPVFTVFPVDIAGQHKIFYHNSGAYDPDGDSLSYKLVTPKQNSNLDVYEYVLPDDPRFYENYNQGNESQTGTPTFEIDPVSGTLTWDAPDARGEYTVAFIVEEWRNIAGTWYKLGFVTRDMQIKVEPTDNSVPSISIESPDCLLLNDTLQVIATDGDGSEFVISGHQELFDLGGVTPSYAVIEGSIAQPYPFVLTNDTSFLRGSPYDILFKVRDIPDAGPGLVNFDLHSLYLRGVKMEMSAEQFETEVQISWEENDSDTVQVWKKVGSYDQEDCLSFDHSRVGYQLIAEVPTIQLNYVNDISEDASGASVCYRINSKYDEGGLGALSDEQCFSVNNNNPVITNISSSSNGIEIIWDFESQEVVDYQVYRKLGNGTFEFQAITTNTSYADETVTLPNQYTYRIVARDNIGSTIGESESGNLLVDITNLVEGRVKLDWSGNTPWSLHNPDSPEHIIYRGTTIDDLQEIDRVNVFENGLSYFDDTNLVNGNSYCYRVLTNGTYGNSEYDGQLDNFTNTSCIQFVFTDVSRKLPQLIIYPNPFDQELQFARMLNDAKILVYDNTGRILKSVDQFSGDKLDLSLLNSGDYIIVINENNQKFVNRIIKK